MSKFKIMQTKHKQKEAILHNCNTQVSVVNFDKLRLTDFHDFIIVPRKFTSLYKLQLCIQIFTVQK